MNVVNTNTPVENVKEIPMNISMLHEAITQNQYLIQSMEEFLAPLIYLPKTDNGNNGGEPLQGFKTEMGSQLAHFSKSISASNDNLRKIISSLQI